MSKYLKNKLEEQKIQKEQGEPKYEIYLTDIEQRFKESADSLLQGEIKITYQLAF